MFLSVTFVLVLLVVATRPVATQSGSHSYTALKFTNDTSSYITYNPDMTALTEKLSVCLWIRKLQSGSSLCPFVYRDFEISMTDSGYYNVFFGSTSLNGKLTSKFKAPQGTWFNYCATWSLTSRTFRVYVNGELVGNETTPSGRTLRTGGPLTLGNIYPGNDGHQFGGEMFNFNMFSKELTATEVAEISSGGLCSQIPEQLEKYRVIKWEDILKLSRSGTVQDFIDPSCAETPEKLKTELVKIKGLLNSTQEELVGVRGELETSQRAFNETKLNLEETKLKLKNLTESKCALTKGNLTKWDIFYSPEYYNKPFTRPLYQQLSETWDSLSTRLFGMTMTDKLIELIKDLDDEQIENCKDIS